MTAAGSRFDSTLESTTLHVACACGKRAEFCGRGSVTPPTWADAGAAPWVKILTEREGLAKWARNEGWRIGIEGEHERHPVVTAVCPACAGEVYA